MQPVYRLLVRSGETLALNAAQFARPAANLFPGFSASEPGSGSPLVRTGATTFREIRSGYVWNPGQLSSWTLTVAENDTMSSSNIQSHLNSQDRTMESLVVGDGVGKALVFYSSYNNNWHYGYFNTATSAFTVGGPLHLGGQTYSGTSRDSTDGYVAGKYFLRGRDGTVYRFNTLASAPTVVETGLAWGVCSNAPSLVSLGGYGVFVTCGVTGPLRLRYFLLQ